MMSLSAEPPESGVTPPEKDERRRHPRIQRPFPAKVRGLALADQEGEYETVVNDISAGGLYLKLPCEIRRGEALSFVVRFMPEPALPDQPGPGLSVTGTVLRSEPQPDGRCGVAVKFTNYRFL